VRRADGSLQLGRTLPGRGAWLCVGSLECLDLAVKRRAVGRALRAQVEAAAVERLRSDLSSQHPQEN
jgi:predicted RNA-binding protein YlxR (DUF448 family)